MKYGKLTLFVCAFSVLFLFGCRSSKVVKNNDNVTTLVVQPIHNPREILIATVGGMEVSNKEDPGIVAESWTWSGNPLWTRDAFDFDLSAIPQNAKIIKAELTLYTNYTPTNGNLKDANFGKNNSIFIQSIRYPWDVNTVTWAGQPQTTTDGEILVPSTSQPFLDLTLDVTNMIKQKVNLHTNYGFLVRLQNENNTTDVYPNPDWSVVYASRIFCSSKYSDASRHPKLVVVYQK